ncbi:MAG: condensation domain-containing protein, partial [Stenotrophomonas sp.]
MNAQVAVGEVDAVERRALSEAQTGLWYAQRLSAAPAAFNTAHVVWFEGALEIARFVMAADSAAAEAEALSLRFGEDADGQPRQWLDPTHRPLL